MRAGRLIALCVSVFIVGLLGSWGWVSSRRVTVASVHEHDGTFRPGGRAGDRVVHRSTADVPRASSTLASAQVEQSRPPADGGASFIEQLYRSNSTAAISLKNGIRRTLRDVSV